MIQIHNQITEDYLKNLGFQSYSNEGEWHNFKKDNFCVSLCRVTQQGFTAGYCYYGSDFIELQSVHELQQLYRLITKKELSLI